jgi:hypothetical protein
MKISVVMQSYLGDYPGARSRPKEKFIRAVNSFLSQIHEDKELIIVSDGCNITKEIYDNFYKNYEEIKFIYLDKKNNKETNNIIIEKNKTSYNFRGFPRSLGCCLATGDIICYFDTDDIILPHHLTTLDTVWKNCPDTLKWINSPIRYVHAKALPWSKELEKRKQEIEDKIKNKKFVDLKSYGIKDIFFEEEFKKNEIRCSSSSISHRKNIKTTWSDSTMMLDDNHNRIKGYNEDHLFVNNLIDNEKCPGMRVDFATLVVCHVRDVYDL